MNRGQISFDFMLAVLFLMVLVQTMQPLSESVWQSYGRVATKSQEREIARDLAAVAAEGMRYAGTSVSYKIPYLNVAGQRGPVGCAISISGSSITVTVDSRHIPDIGVAISQSVAAGSTLGNYSLSCGQQITISGGSIA